MVAEAVHESVHSANVGVSLSYLDQTSVCEEKQMNETDGTVAIVAEPADGS
jgi:hypothetical protein